MRKKSIVIMVTLLVLAFGASAAMARGWGGGWGSCGMTGQYTSNSGPYNCPMMGTPGNYYCPRTGTGYCAMITGPGQYTPSATTTDASGQYYTTNGGWGCW